MEKRTENGTAHYQGPGSQPYALLLVREPFLDARILFGERSLSFSKSPMLVIPVCPVPEGNKVTPQYPPTRAAERKYRLLG
eukprot:1145227-Pelagomonas_calceolata.AAC.4